MLPGTLKYYLVHSLRPLLTSYVLFSLNGLTVASRVHILEPQWNPATEKQAIGRVVRPGQHLKVTIVKYVTQNTVEEVSKANSRRLLAKRTSHLTIRIDD